MDGKEKYYKICFLTQESNATLDLSTGGAYECEVVVHTVHKPMDLRIFHPARQPPQPGTGYFSYVSSNNTACTGKHVIGANCFRSTEITELCASLNCSGLCLLSPAEGGVQARCACPEHWLLAADGRSCVHNCTAAHFVCRTTLKCIPYWWRCDTQVCLRVS